jgi:hypothetical protein
MEQPAGIGSDSAPAPSHEVRVDRRHPTRRRRPFSRSSSANRLRHALRHRAGPVAVSPPASPEAEAEEGRTTIFDVNLLE